MKKTAALFSIALTISSCALKEQEVSVCEKVELTITTTSQQGTRTGMGDTGDFFWTSGDALKVFETADTPNSFSIYDSSPGATDDGGKTMTFGVSLESRSASSFTYNAFYPKTSLYGTPESATAVAINVPSTQTPSPMTFDKTADILIAKSVTGISSQPTTLSLQFARPVAIANAIFTGLPEDSKITSFTFSAVKGGTAVSVAGATTFDLVSARPVGKYGDAASVTEIVVDCKDIDYSLLGSAKHYSIYDFNWDTEELSDPTTAGTIKDGGLLFTCWPFSLGEGDSFKVVVRIGDYLYSRNVSVPSGRTFEMPEGGIGTFTLDMSSVTPEYSPDDYLSRWNSGQDLEIGGRTYNKATFGAGILIEDGGSIPSRTGVYFIDTDASVTLTGAWSSYSQGNLILIGRTPGNRPSVVKTSAPCYYNGADGYIAMKNVRFRANSVPAFNFDAKMAAVDIDDCTMEIGLLYSSVNDNTGAENVCIKDSKLALCKEDVQPGNRENGITRGLKNTSMTRFEFCRNVVYPLNGTPSRLGFNQDLTSSVTNTVEEVVFKDNLFVDVEPYTAYANWTNDYKLTVTGNILDFEGSRPDALSVTQSAPELSYFARRYSAGVESSLSDVTEGGNAVYYTVPSYYCTAAVCQPRTETNRYQVATPQETVLSNRDFTTGEFPLKKGALYAEAFTSDGTRFWGSVDCTNHKIYINHVPRTDMITEVKIWPESCECSALSGSWPSKTITVDGIQYDVLLPDYVEGTPLSGYTLQWADEFTLDHVERQAWRNNTSGGASRTYLCPSDNTLETVSDGTLKLWYRTVTDSGTGYWPSGSSLGYVAGGIDTRYRRDFSFNQDARMQVRMKWTEMKGLWQAAWMLADPNQGFGTSRQCVGGEMDIIEHLATGYTMFQTLHTENTVTNDSSPANCGQVRAYKSPHDNTWFTFDVEVTGAGTSGADINFYINGTKSSWYYDYKKYHPKSYWSAETGTGYYWPFDIFEYCMILTAQVGGDWCGEPDGTTAIAAGSKAMTVDYVRFYTKN